MIFCYLVGTQGKSFTFDPNSDMKLYWYVDADFARLWKHEDDQDPLFVKSRTWYVMTLGWFPLYWLLKLHTYIALSTLQAEYISLSQAMRDLLPLIWLLQEVGTQSKMDFSYPTNMHSTVFEGKNGALGFAASPRKTPRTHQVAVNYHFLR